MNLYLDQVHHDTDTVAVVISHPAQPSRLVRELEQTLQGTWGLAETADVLLELARRATRRFTVMTPFVDDDGAGRIIELLDLTAPGVRREIIVRGGLPPALQLRRADLERLEAAVFDFRISRDEGAGTETFHAKVVRVDSDECYVGSSNMTAWSFNYSLELGFHVRGAAGKRISQVVDAVLQVSQPALA
ncbi:phospholipase D-like domain-containing protein [Ideonella sp. DXS22W]|uniref:Phospholipase D-like domain-containing protein n=1 Tax=Pseudaquabacterium inlustre TaxID=2984192 RepID=A0ABU9CBB7_9BURK